MTCTFKCDVLIDGQFGSTGKGLFAGYWAQRNYYGVFLSNGSPNAGHTCLVNGKKYVTRHLPMGAVITGAPCFLGAGSIIDLKVLREECEKNEYPAHRVYIHKNAAVIQQKHLDREGDDWCTKIASTMKGAGSALVDKVRRDPAAVIGHHNVGYNVVKSPFEVYDKFGYGLLEIPQGIGLGINSGFYPYTTSREISVSQGLADMGLHPHQLGRVLMSIRTFPIRVGHLYRDGEKIGDSGPFYPDSEEITWGEIGTANEMTTVTGRVRRVATFSVKQFEFALRSAQPNVVFLNFCNHLSKSEEADLVHEILKVAYRLDVGFKIYLGRGPDISDVEPIDTGGIVQ